MVFVRWILGRLILLIDFLTSPKATSRPAQQQTLLDQQTAKMALYQFHACPFCVKVRRAIKRNGLKIELRDAKNDPDFRQELEQQGGQLKVPCLKMVDSDGRATWMYESSDIVRFLDHLITPETQPNTAPQPAQS